VRACGGEELARSAGWHTALVNDAVDAWGDLPAQLRDRVDAALRSDQQFKALVMLDVFLSGADRGQHGDGPEFLGGSIQAPLTEIELGDDRINRLPPASAP
jgi:hypothetical protein